jgi:hypothetical protein
MEIKKLEGPSNGFQPLFDFFQLTVTAYGAVKKHSAIWSL